MSEKIDFKAFEDDGADQFLRETMSGHRVEPKPGIWKDISRKLLWQEFLRFNFTNLSPKIWITATIGFLVVVSGIYVGFQATSPDETTSSPLVKYTQGSATAASPVVEPTAGLLVNSGQYRNKQTTVTPEADNPGTAGLHETKVTAPQNRLIAQAANFKKTQGVRLAEEDDQGIEAFNAKSLSNFTEPQPESAADIPLLVPIEAALLPVPTGYDTIITISIPAGVLKVRKTKPESTQFFSINLGLMPELAVYSEPAAHSNVNYWVHAGITYHISRFSVTSGVGMGYVYDEGKYNVEYISKDSVGYYNNVTSYTIGSNNEIIYNTQTVSVYDSLYHIDNPYVKNRYSYLQVPLLLGYRLFVSNKVSLTFQAGPAVSVLLRSQSPEPDHVYSNGRVISVENQTPSRVQTSWQIWTDLYFEMRLNKKLSLYLDPSFKYYMNPVATQENVKFKAPWAIGLGVGLQFNFGQKKTSP